MHLDDLKRFLEDQIDNVGLASLLEVVEIICTEKAAHIQESYNDKALAKKWDKANAILLDAKRKIHLINL